MTTKPSSSETVVAPRRARGHGAAIVAMLTLIVAAVAWWWTTRQPPHDAGLGLSHGVIVIGAGTFVLALIAQIRAMSFLDVLEMLWELLLGVFALIGAVLKGLWSLVCRLLGWD